MNIDGIKDSIIFISVTILYIATSVILYYVFKDNLIMTMFLEGMILINLSMWIECNIFIKNFKKRVLKVQEEKNR